MKQGPVTWKFPTLHPQLQSCVCESISPHSSSSDHLSSCCLDEQKGQCPPGEGLAVSTGSEAAGHFEKKSNGLGAAGGAVKGKAWMGLHLQQRVPEVPPDA